MVALALGNRNGIWAFILRRREADASFPVLDAGTIVPRVGCRIVWLGPVPPAGGKHICAACLPVTEAHDLVIDQTLYWKIFLNEDATWFCVGMLNSHAMTEAIAPFNPKGAFGERHIHALPYRLMPTFDPANEDHRRIAALARALASAARTIIGGDAYLSNPSRALTARRTKLRTHLSVMAQMGELDELCAAVLGTTVAVADSEDLPDDEDEDA